MEAREKTEEATDKEKIILAISEAQIGDNGYQKLDETNFQEALKKQFEGRKLQLTDNGDGSFIINLDNMSKKYYVDSNCQIISNENIVSISTADELKAFRDDVNSGNSYEGKYVYLTSDITLDSSEEWEPIGYYVRTTDEKNPDTTTNKPFKGIFDGGNYTINGINITTNKSYQGLFSFVIDGTIKNVTISENNNITGDTRVGGVVGYLYGFKGNISNCVNYSDIDCSDGGGIVGLIAGQNMIYNCKNYGTITGAGGIVGSSNGTDWKQFTSVSNTITNCGNYGNVTKENGGYCGGIVGYLKGDILNSYNQGNIIGILGVGGITGAVENGNIRNCYNIGLINANGESAGGIAGNMNEKSNLSNCYNTGEINNKSQKTGGIIGQVDSNYNDVIKIKNCINYAPVVTNNYGGGIVGFYRANIDVENCYNLGNISGYIGISSIIGYTEMGNANIKDCFYLDTITQDQNAVAIKIDEMPNSIDIINGENKFKEDTNNVNNGYPILAWQ